MQEPDGRVGRVLVRQAIVWRENGRLLTAVWNSSLVVFLGFFFSGLAVFFSAGEVRGAMDCRAPGQAQSLPCWRADCRAFSHCLTRSFLSWGLSPVARAREDLGALHFERPMTSSAKKMVNMSVRPTRAHDGQQTRH